MAISFQDSLFACAASGLLVHLSYHKLEPKSMLSHAAAFFGLPLALAYNLARFESQDLALLHGFGLFFAFLSTSVVFYRLGPMHPLSQYSGPTLLKLSKIPMAWISYRGNKHDYLFDLHQKYGKVVRIGPNHLSFSDGAVLRDMMGRKGLPKGSFWIGFAPDIAHSSLLGVIPKTEHTERRKAWERGFNAEALHGYDERVVAHTAQLAEEFEKIASEPINISTWCDWYAFDNMTDMAFSGSVDMIRNGDKGGLWHKVLKTRRYNYFFSQIPWTAPIIKFLLGLNLHPAAAFRKVAFDMISERLARGSSVPDLFYHLVDESENGPKAVSPSSSRMIADGSTAIAAGSDTTSTALAHSIYFLLSNPHVYKRLQEEIDNVFPGAEEASDATKQSHMPILNGVINETLRLYPIVASGSQRVMVHTEDNRGLLGPYAVPSGTEVQLHTYSLQRDPSNFSPAPEDFIVDRWLPEEERDPSLPKITQHNVSAYIPFSYGPSNCVGKSLAIFEMRMMLSMILKRFDIQRAKDFDLASYKNSIQDQFGSLHGALMVTLTPRK